VGFAAAVTKAVSFMAEIGRSFVSIEERGQKLLREDPTYCGSHRSFVLTEQGGSLKYWWDIILSCRRLILTENGVRKRCWEVI
jgi:hypothetical protein